MHLKGLYVAIKSMDPTKRGGEGKGVMFDNQLLQSKTFQHLENNYFYLNDFDVDEFLSDNSETRTHLSGNFDPNSVQFLEILEIAYSGEQLPILEKFLDELFITEDYEKVKILARNFQNNLNGANLTEDEKLELLSVGVGIYALADFLDKGGMELVGEKLNVIQKESGYTYNLRCRVESRAVWGGAVIGLTYGAVRGGMVGCAGGTVVFPGLGTATGCVGGAVFGGAIGFIEGAATGIASSLLLTCFR